MVRRFLFISLFTFQVVMAFGQLPVITFAPHWLPQAQFAGYYMALEKGFYREEGIEVKIIHPSAAVMATEKLVNGESDMISLFMITALSVKDKGIDLVNIAQLSQHSALLFVAKKKRNILTLDDLNQKRIGIWKSGFDEVPKALVNSNNYKVTWVPILSSVNMFMIDGVDAMTVMWYNEYDQIINAGFNPDELSSFFFSEYGYDVPEDGIYCLNKTLLQREDDLQKFVKGTLKGWEYARDHKEETVQVVMQIMRDEHVASNLAHQSWMLDRMLELIEPGSKNVKKGELAESDFHKAQTILMEDRRIVTKISFSDFYKPVIVE